jgi:hypothetical protein
MKDYYLFLDDERMPKNVTWVNLPAQNWQIVRSYDEFVNFIMKNGVPCFVSFDHDLAHEHYRQSMYNPDRHYNNYYDNGTFKEKTGYHCARWLVEYCFDNNFKLPEYIAHTMNPIGRENIQGIMEQAKRIERNRS